LANRLLTWFHSLVLYFQLLQTFKLLAMHKEKKPEKKGGSKSKTKAAKAKTSARKMPAPRGITPGTIGIGVPLSEKQMEEVKRNAEKLDE